MGHTVTKVVERLCRIFVRHASSSARRAFGLVLAEDVHIGNLSK
jgi:hypothetical protein